MIGEALRIPQNLRDYQRDAVDAIKASCDKGEKPICACATGAGKTTILSQALREMVDPYTQRALVIVHVSEIVHQIYDRLCDQFDGALDRYYGFMKPGIGIVMADDNAITARIVVATRQSLYPKRLAALLEHGVFDVIVVDEAHHFLASEVSSYNKIIQTCETANPKLKRFGMTATPERGDKQALESSFTNICYEWSIQTGIETGYLAPVTRLKVKTKVDLSKIKSHMGDYAHGKLASVLGAENWTELCVRAYEQFIAPEGRLALAFMPSVDMSKAFVTALNDANYSAAHIDGETPKEERADLLRQYTAGKLRVLSNFAVFIEGVDLPATSAILLARPTRSRTLLTQMLGRGLRLFPGKKDCLLVDMTIHDVKVLTAGSLVGAMKTCPKCDADIWKFLKVCSHCGYEYPEIQKLVDDSGTWFGSDSESWVGKDLVAEVGSLFDNAVAAWYKAPDGTMSCSMPIGEGVLFIVPPNKDQYYRMYRVPQHGPIAFEARNEDVISLIRSADDMAKAAGRSAIKSNNTWREGGASPGQLALLQKLGFTSAAPLTKGQAAELISHIIAEQRLQAMSAAAARKQAAQAVPTQ